MIDPPDRDIENMGMTIIGLKCILVTYACCYRIRVPVIDLLMVLTR